MFSPETYRERRRLLAEAVSSGLILLPGNNNAPMNYAGNVYRFRQDGSFLYYAGLDAPGLSLTLDADSGEAVLYGHDPTMDDVVWEGPLPSLSERAASVGVTKTAVPERLADDVSKARRAGRKVHVLPPYRGDQKLMLGKLLGTHPDEVVPSQELIEAVVAQRLVKSDEEIAELERAVALSAEMHLLAMRMAQPGRSEQKIAAAMEGIALANGGYTSFPIILTRRGEVLHNQPTSYIFQKGDLMLTDGGAQVAGSRYSGDITRVSPVGGRFSDQQRTLYQIVLDAQMKAIDACKPDVAFRDIHLLACRSIAEGLKAVGLMKGDPYDAVEAGAHALFMPHGLGHAIGLDVHDMEALGEDNVGYGEEFRRSDQFGLAFLRYGKRLKAGNVMTVEPGIYLIGALTDKWKSEGKHTDFISYDEFERWRDFGGIRIEDDIVVTEEGCRILGPAIPKQPNEVEEVVQSGVAAFSTPLSV
ncbi:MAG: aminopeptidase P family protein [Rubricoccaceae bacterium]|nr:aminopeptidase P family protein [Rubricoccaceae bacterium]